LINFFTFQISMFFSASLAWASLIVTDGEASARDIWVGYAEEIRLCSTDVSRTNLFVVVLRCVTKGGESLFLGHVHGPG
jgi:hypothetical protein